MLQTVFPTYASKHTIWLKPMNLADLYNWIFAVRHFWESSIVPTVIRFPWKLTNNVSSKYQMFIVLYLDEDDTGVVRPILFEHIIKWLLFYFFGLSIHKWHLFFNFLNMRQISSSFTCFVQVGAQTSIKTVEFDLPLVRNISVTQPLMVQNKISYVPKTWMTLKEPISVWSENNFTIQGVLEHLNVTKDHSDYLWRITRYIITCVSKLATVRIGFLK